MPDLDREALDNLEAEMGALKDRLRDLDLAPWRAPVTQRLDEYRRLCFDYMAAFSADLITAARSGLGAQERIEKRNTDLAMLRTTLSDARVWLNAFAPDDQRAARERLLLDVLWSLLTGERMADGGDGFTAV